MRNFRGTDENSASGIEHCCLQNLEQDTKAIVSSKSDKKPPVKRRKRKGDSQKNNSFDVLTLTLLSMHFAFS